MKGKYDQGNHSLNFHFRYWANCLILYLFRDSFPYKGEKKEIKTLSEEFPNKEKEKYIYYSLGGKKVWKIIFFVKFVFKGEEKYFPKATLPQLDLIAL